MRELRRRLIGIVTSDKMDKTVVVEVTTQKRHPLYHKIIHVTKKYKAHDEGNQCQVGDRVRIIESKPISREKCWAVVDIIERAQ